MTRADNIREMGMRDLPKVRELLRQLGYDLDEGELVLRFKAVEAEETHALRVASNAGDVVGFVHMYCRPALEKPPETIVQALVVDEASRGHGIGRHLMQTAEDWARERGFTSIALATQVTRDDAKEFYASLGYERAATSDLMRKKI